MSSEFAVMNRRPTAHVSQAMNTIFDDHAELADMTFACKDRYIALGNIGEVTREKKSLQTLDLPVEWVERFAEAMKKEVEELQELIPRKWWSQDELDLDAARVELVDIFHFLLSAAMALGLSGEDFINLYYQKRSVNFKRLEDGYKSKEKGERDDKHVKIES